MSPINLPTALAPEPFRFFPEDTENLPDPGFGQIVSAAFRRENTFVSFLNRLSSPERVDFADGMFLDTNYDPFDNIEGTVFEEYPEALIGVTSPEERAGVEQRLHRELRDLDTLNRGGALSMAAIFGAAVLDPILLVPVGGQVAAGAKVGQGALKMGLATARAALLGETATEMVLGATQDTRTLGESALNVTAATLLAGTLGSAIGSMSASARRAAADQASRDLAAIAGGSGAEIPTISLDELAVPTLSDATKIKLTSAFGVEKLAGKARLSPFVNIMVNSKSGVAKQTVAKLADWPVLVEGLPAGQTAESQFELWHAVVDQLLERGDDMFVSYRRRLAGKGAKPEGQAIRNRIRAARITAKDRITGQPKGVIGRKEFHEEVGRAARNMDEHYIPEVQEMARMYRKQLFDPLLEEGIELGRFNEEIRLMGPKGARSYLTRLYKTEKIIAERPVFRQRITNWLISQMDDSEIETAISKHDGLGHAEAIQVEAEIKADNIIENITGNSVPRLIHDPIGGGSSSALKDRVLTISDTLLEDWLEQDITQIARRYVRTVASDLALHKTFGSIEMDAPIKAINDEYVNLMNAATTEKARTALGRQRTKDLEIVRALRDRLRGTYAVPAPSPFVTASRVARTMNMMSQGGGFMVSSLADPGTVVLRNGIWRTFRSGIVPLVTNLKAVRLAAKEIKLAGSALELGLDSRAALLADLGDEFARNRVERVAQIAGSNFSVVNLLAPWNTAIKSFAGVITQTRMIEVLEALADGKKVAKFDLQDLRASGIEPGSEMFQRIARQLKSGHVQRSKGLAWARTMDWDDVGARDAFRSAMRRSIDSQVVTPGIADRPLWMSKELGKLAGQYKSFAFSATQRILLTTLQRRDAAWINGVALAWALGMFVEWSKSAQAELTRKGSGNLDRPMESWVVGGLDRSGLIGIIGDAVNMADKVGVLNLKGGPISSRYAARNVSSTILGPTAGLMQSGISVGLAVSRGDVTQTDTRTLRRIIPYQNLFYARSVFDMLEDSANDAFGVPKRRRARR